MANLAFKHPEPDAHRSLQIMALNGLYDEMDALGVLVKACDGRIIQPDAQRMAHVVHCSAANYLRSTPVPKTGVV